MFAARVIIAGVPKKLSYAVDPQNADNVAVGSEVTVEVGARQAKGWVIEKVSLESALEELPHVTKRVRTSAKQNSPQLGLFSDGSALATDITAPPLKPILNASPAFLPVQLKLFEWMAHYYGSPLVDVIDNAVPRRSTSRPQLFAKLSDSAKRQVKETPDFVESLRRRAPVQSQLLTMLVNCACPLAITDLELFIPSARGALKQLEKKKMLEVIALSHLDPELLRANPDAGIFATTQPTQLTAGQQHAVETIVKTVDARSFSPFLLFGVTGSGKTEVYLQVIQHALAKNLSALIILPEIALTPQLLDRFQSRLHTPVAVLHSQVGSSARWAAWEALLNGTIRVALGARSAVFAPMKDLGVIVVDEEHETSYKQSDGLRYNGRDVAVMRSKFASCPVILGSATPSFESLLNVKKKRYTMLEMPDRATSRPVPEIEIIDLTKIRRKEMISENISPLLYEAIRETLSKKEQVVILYNRRGFASYLQCDTCGEVVCCSNCSVSFTYHQERNELKCHYCDVSIPKPSHCHFCRDPKTSRLAADETGAPLERDSVTKKIGKLSHRGGGTEKVVDELTSLFPEAVLVRMDRDTVGKKDAYRQILGSMRSGATDILVGTQMIAKGHDLPGVTLVGIIDSDIGLHLPDFRSTERVFQLITQAAGRAGRGNAAGRVLVQTREPNHPTIVATATGRFKAFARYELEQRKVLHYPPWGRLLRLVVSSANPNDAARVTKTVHATLNELIQWKVKQVEREEREKLSMTVLGPTPATHVKLRGRYRWHMLVKSDSATAISEIAGELNRWKRNVKHLPEFRLGVDVDPVDML